MAESQQEEEDLALTAGYKAPAQKSLDEINNLDAEDESLRRYKEALLGTGAVSGGAKKVTVKKLSVVVEGRDDISMDLTGDLAKLKNSPITIKEGAEYRLKLQFTIEGEIVPGLRFVTTIHRKGIKVDTLVYMVGSYGPKPDHEFSGTQEEAPKGMLARGQYKAKSKFIDDDKTIYLAWEWTFDIKKDWE